MNITQRVEIPRSDLLGGSKQLLIGGKWQAAASGKEFETFNPATGQVIARVAEGDAVDVDRAVAAARRAFEGEWSRWSPYDRQRLMIRPHDLIEANFEELAYLETVDMGKPIARTPSLKGRPSQAILCHPSQMG